MQLVRPYTSSAAEGKMSSDGATSFGSGAWVLERTRVRSLMSHRLARPVWVTCWRPQKTPSRRRLCEVHGAVVGQQRLLDNVIAQKSSRCVSKAT